MKKMNYIKPVAEVVMAEAKDIIRTSAELPTTVSGSTSYLEGMTYDEAYNVSGGRIKLN